jgi:tetratricopeptide (TPR) repeat protein
MSSGGRLDALLRMVEQDPDDAFCLYGVAQEHAKAGRFEEAVAWYRRAIAADPAHAYARFHMAKALESLGRVPEAMATLREGLAAARGAGDAKAANELAGYLDELTP